MSRIEEGRDRFDDALDDRLKRSLDNDLKKGTAVDKAARTAIVGEAALLAKGAKSLRSRVNEGKPSSAEAEALLGRAAKLRAFIESHQVPESSTAWASLAPRVQMLANAYGASAATTTR